MSEICTDGHDWEQVYMANLEGDLFDLNYQECQECGEKRPDPDVVSGTPLSEGSV